MCSYKLKALEDQPVPWNGLCSHYSMENLTRPLHTPLPEKDTLWSAACPHKTKIKSHPSETVVLSTSSLGDRQRAHTAQSINLPAAGAQPGEMGCKAVHSSIETSLSPKHLALCGIILTLMWLFRLHETEIWANFSFRRFLFNKILLLNKLQIAPSGLMEARATQSILFPAIMTLLLITVWCTLQIINVSQKTVLGWLYIIYILPIL